MVAICLLPFLCQVQTNVSSFHGGPGRPTRTLRPKRSIVCRWRPTHSAQTEAKDILYLNVKLHIGSKGGSSLKEPVFSRRSGWEREAQSFCAFSQSLSSFYRPSLLPRGVPGGLQAVFDPHQPRFLGQIGQCNR